MNNPIKFLDPTGHRVSCGDGGVGTCGGDTLEYLAWAFENNSIDEAEYLRRASAVVTRRAKLDKEIYKDSFKPGYQGKLPINILDDLMARGADRDLVDNVTIDIEVNKCKEGNAAQTWFSHITYCDIEYFDRENINGLLAHELIHVRQFNEGGIPFAIDYSIRYFILRVRKMDIYVNLPAEIEARHCQRNFNKNSSISFDSGFCRLK